MTAASRDGAVTTKWLGDFSASWTCSSSSISEQLSVQSTHSPLQASDVPPALLLLLLLLLLLAASSAATAVISVKYTRLSRPYSTLAHPAHTHDRSRAHSRCEVGVCSTRLH